MTNLVFLDTETTSLDADTGEIWEVGAIVRQEDGTETEYHWFLPVTLVEADPISLKIGKFHERYTVPSIGLEDFAWRFWGLTKDTHLVGNIVSFDEERLRKLIRRHGLTPGWHYHLVDVESLVAGHLKIGPPWKSADLSEAAGVALPSEEERHTALADARWAMRLYDEVLGASR
jgi:DNA polymerase III epsilon subunit-like protein